MTFLGIPSVRGLSLRLLAWVMLTVSSGLAHHSPGHGPSEGLRALSALGTNSLPRQRAALLLEVARTSAEPTLNTATTASITALLDVKVWERLYLSGAVPVGIVREDLTQQAKFGQGDVRLGFQVALGSMARVDAASVTVGASVSIPTRTVRYELDPGRQWVYSPGVRYAATSGRLLWTAALLSPIEIRPAGVAWELSPAWGLGVRLVRAWTVSVGGALDVRVFNGCSESGALVACPDGRPTELDRPVGAARLYGIVGSTLDLSESWSLFGNGQIPLLARRDIEWSLSLGLEGRF